MLQHSLPLHSQQLRPNQSRDQIPQVSNLWQPVFFPCPPITSRVQSEHIFGLGRDGTCLFCPCGWQGPGPPGGSFLIHTPWPSLNTGPDSGGARRPEHFEHFVSYEGARRFFEASQAQFKPHWLDLRARPRAADPQKSIAFNEGGGHGNQEDPCTLPFKKRPHSSLARRYVNPRESHRLPPASSARLADPEKNPYFPAPGLTSQGSAAPAVANR